MKIKELNESLIGTVINDSSIDPVDIYKRIRKYYRWIKFNEEHNLLHRSLIEGHKEDFKELVDEFIYIQMDRFIGTRQSANLRNLRHTI